MKGNLYVRTPVCVPAAEIQLITVHTVDCTDTIYTSNVHSSPSVIKYSAWHLQIWLWKGKFLLSAIVVKLSCILSAEVSVSVCILNHMTACFPSEAAPWSKYNQYFIMTVYQWLCVMWKGSRGKVKSLRSASLKGFFFCFLDTSMTSHWRICCSVTAGFVNKQMIANNLARSGTI